MHQPTHQGEHGFALTSILIILAVVAVLGGSAYYMSAPTGGNKDSVACTTEAKLCPDGSSVGRTGPNCEFSECPTVDTSETSATKEDATEKITEKTGSDTATTAEVDSSNISKDVTFSGQLLAGTKIGSQLLKFNQSDYDKAVTSNKLILLYFYANWCPTCKEELPKLESAFDALNDPNVVGFRVSYKDSETTKDAEAIARKFGVAYQHTKVFVYQDKQVKKSPEGYPTTQHYLTTIKQVISQL
jgi:thiol-disulfide isomerase/thioredoxin